MAFIKGQSGNPKGRPKKGRALTELLETALNKTTTWQGKSIARKRLLAELLVSLVTDGRIEFTDGRFLEVDDVNEWATITKWLYRHIDGDKVVEISAPTNEPLPWNDDDDDE